MYTKVHNLGHRIHSVKVRDCGKQNKLIYTLGKNTDLQLAR